MLDPQLPVLSENRDMKQPLTLHPTCLERSVFTEEVALIYFLFRVLSLFLTPFLGNHYCSGYVQNPFSTNFSSRFRGTKALVGIRNNSRFKTYHTMACRFDMQERYLCARCPSFIEFVRFFNVLPQSLNTSP